MRDALGVAADKTRAALEAGAAACLDSSDALELVECGVLASTFGAGHQRCRLSVNFFWSRVDGVELHAIDATVPSTQPPRGFPA